MVIQLIPLELHVSSCASVLASVRTRVFQREPNREACCSYKISPVLLGMTPNSIAEILARLRTFTSVADRHLTSSPAYEARACAYLEAPAVLLPYAAFETCEVRDATQALAVLVRVLPDP